MRNFLLASLFLSLVAAVAVVPASADSVVYSSGPLHGQTDAWQINDANPVSDTFSFTGPYNWTITGATFAVWLNPGDALSSVKWSIGTSAYGSDVASGTVSPTANTGFANGYGEEVYTESFSSLDMHLTAGTYYFTLQGTQVKNGNVINHDPAYWDENDGTSLGFSPATSPQTSIGAWDCANAYGCGLTGGETFGLDGFYAPEPSSFMLLGSGLVGLAGMLKRKLKA